MLVVDTPHELAAHVGARLGPGEWREVSQDMILGFASLCGDDHWTHTDPERAARETPFGGVIAQGFLTLSLTTSMFGGCLKVRRADRWFNYGLDRVRFTHPVRAADRLRLTGVLAAVGPAGGGGTRIEAELTVEIAGQDKPALVARSILLAFA